MKIKLNGTTRIVFIFNKIVIKIPNFLICHRHFLYGCYANYSERNYCKMFKPINDEMKTFYNKVAPSYFCSIFGLMQIQAKCEQLNRCLTKKEIKYFEDACNGDAKKENFGYYDKRLVCLDYA